MKSGVSLQIEKDWFSPIFEQSLDAIIIFDDEGRFLAANPATVDLFGFPLDTLLSMKIGDLETTDAISAEDRLQTYLEKAHEKAEFVLLRPDGERRVIEYSAACVGPGEHFSIIRDITERKMAEEALKFSEARFTAFMRHMPGVAFIKDPSGRYVFTNETVAKIQNKSPNSLGMTDEEIFSKEAAAQFRENDRLVLRTGRTLQVLENALIDGEMRSYLITKFPIPDKDSASAFLGGVGVDITERCRIDEALRESELRFRQMAESVSELFWLSSFDMSKIFYVSPAYEKIWGRSCQSLYDCPMSFAESIHPDDRAHFDKQQELKRAGRLFQCEYRIVRADGSMRWICAQGFPVHNEKGEFIRIAGIAQDITGRKQAEEALLASQARLHSLSRQLIDAQEAERRRISLELHDGIGQALTAIKINLYNAQKSGNPSPMLTASMKSIDQTLSDLRELSLALRPLSLDDLGLSAALQACAKEHGMRAGVDVRFTSNLIDIRMSREIETACFRIVQEALTNFVRHSRAKSMEIDCRQDDGKLGITVTDDGIGFNVEDKLARAARGETLGLLGMQERAQVLGGKLEIHSSEGAGTKLRLHIPMPALKE